MHQQFDVDDQLGLMESPLANTYKNKIWDVYAHAVSTISILALVVAFVIGAYDLVKLAFPAFTLNSALHEKYRTNESYTEFGTFKKELSEDKISRERTANYDKLVRMERRDALQRLVKVASAVIVIAILNGALVLIGRKRSERTP